MKNRIEPTHFIEQYNVTDKYKGYEGRQENFGIVMRMESLQNSLERTRVSGVIHTVALWKIKYKDNSIT